MLLGNFLHQNRNTVREVGLAITNPLAQFKYSNIAAFYTGEPTNNTQYSSFPDGTRPPESWHLAPKAGGLSARMFSEGDITADALAVKLAEAAISGSGTISNAFGALVVQLLADISGSGGISDADVKAFLAAVASIGGSGEISDAAASGLGAMVASMLGMGTAAGSTATGVGAMSADLVVTGTGLTTSNVGQAVWSALAAANNVTGTMGEKLNDAGSGSNPWTEVIESGYTAAEILRLLAAVAAGSATGLEGTNPAFVGIDGVTTRVEGTYASGTRVITNLDGS